MLIWFIFNEDTNQVMHALVLIFLTILVDIELFTKKAIPIFLKLCLGCFTDHLTFNLDWMFVILIKETLYSTSWKIACWWSYLRRLTIRGMALRSLVRKTDSIMNLGRSGTWVSLKFFEFRLALLLVDLRKLVWFEICYWYHVSLILLDACRAMLFSHLGCLS